MTSRAVLRNAALQLQSIPVCLKILGIGVLGASLFGVITLYSVQTSVTPALYELLEQRTLTTAHAMADSLQEPMITGDLFAMDERVQKALSIFPDLRYAIVYDHQRSIAMHTFERAVPLDLTRLSPGGERLRVLGSPEGDIFECTAPLLDGRAGLVRVGLSDRTIRERTAQVRISILRGLALSGVLGAGLALLLTHLLTHPLHRLVLAANRIARGDFGARARLATTDEVGQLGIAFDQMAGSLERYRAELLERDRVRAHLLERMVDTQEEERRSIARELHDQLGQSLMALLLTIQSNCSARTVQDGTCREMEGRIRQLTEDVRRMAWGMRPPILDDYGLESALRRLIEEVSQRSQISVDFQYSSFPEAGRLPPSVEMTLYRVSQEALANVVRHSQASRASVVVIQQSRMATLLVDDNGRGFDASDGHAGREGRMGIASMRERAALLGGSLVVDSTPGSGTTVRVTIPLGEQEPCQSAS